MIQYCPTSTILEGTITKAIIWDLILLFQQRAKRMVWHSSVKKCTSLGFPFIGGTVPSTHSLHERQLKTVKGEGEQKAKQNSHWIHTKVTKWRQARLNLTSIWPNLSCLNGERSMEERRYPVALQASDHNQTQHHFKQRQLPNTAHLDMLKDADVNIEPSAHSFRKKGRSVTTVLWLCSTQSSYYKNSKLP